MFTIHDERPELAALIHEMLVSAFPTATEALLVDDLRAAGALRISCVALDGAVVLGHVGFSLVSIRPERSSVVLWALAPLAVAPNAQRRGIGSALVRAGLEACATAGCDGVVVVGDPRFYQRFGFRPAAEYGLKCSFDVPPEAFMLIEIRPGKLSLHAGVVHFHPAFDRVAALDELPRQGPNAPTLPQPKGGLVVLPLPADSPPVTTGEVRRLEAEGD